jgi:hypothetical protein
MIGNWCARLGAPRQPGRRAATLFALALAVALLAGATLLRVWLRNETVSVSIAGFYMVSDGSNHYECANGLLDEGRLINAWCERRPVYAAMLASLSALTARVWFATMLLQAVLVALCALALARAASRHFGTLVGLASFAMLFAYSRETAFPVSMTENAGLVYGMLGVAFLLDSATHVERRRLALGTALLSLGLVARSGPFLMLPALAVWAFFRPHPNLAQRWQSAALVLVAATTGPLVQLLLTLAADGSLSNVQGNFSYTLYGLAVGGRGWQAVLADHPELQQLARTDEALAARRIYSLAVTAFLDNPRLLLLGLARNAAHFLKAPMFDTPGAAFLGIVNVFWWVGAVAIVLRRHNAAYSLLGWLSLGLVASASVITLDGGARAFAAGFPVQAVQASLALGWLAQLYGRAAGLVTGPEEVIPIKPGKLEVALAVVAVFLIVLPATPVRRAFAPSIPKPPACAPGLVSAVVRPGHETHILALVPGAQPLDVLRMRVSPDRLIKRLRGDGWSAQVFGELPKPITLFRAWPLDAPPDGRLRAEVRFFAAGDQSDHMYRTLHACLDETQTVTVAYVPYSKVVSLSVLSRP